RSHEQPADRAEQGKRRDMHAGKLAAARASGNARPGRRRPRCRRLRRMAIPDHLRRLLADCDVETYRASGPGGQHRNKTESAVRMTHRPSGIVRVATEHRSQLRNRELALERIWKALEARRRKPKPRVATKPSKAAKG